MTGEFDVKMYDFPIDLSREDCRRLVAELHDKDAQLAEREADCAAYREAIDKYVGGCTICEGSGLHDGGACPVCSQLRDILSGHPGENWLAVVEAAQAWRKARLCYVTGSKVRKAISDLLGTLAALDGEE